MTPDQNARQLNKSVARRRWVNLGLAAVVALLLLAGALMLGSSWLDKNTQAESVSGIETNLEVTANTTQLTAIAGRLASVEAMVQPINYDALLMQLKTDLVGVAELSGSSGISPESASGGSPDKSGESFQRNPDIDRLVDDLNNPGGLIDGEFTRQYCAETYTARGRTFAVCDTRAHGIAALIELIMAHKGRTIAAYIGGGDGRNDPWWNYTGGDQEEAALYLDVFVDAGIDEAEIINGNTDQLTRMVRAHSRMEGSQIPVTDDDLNAAFLLVQNK